MTHASKLSDLGNKLLVGPIEKKGIKNNGSTFSSLMDPCLLRCTVIKEINMTFHRTFY